MTIKLNIEQLSTFLHKSKLVNISCSEEESLIFEQQFLKPNNEQMRINKESLDLLASDEPVIVKQGSVSDCHFVSAINAILREKPSLIKEMVSFDSDRNIYNVNLKYKEDGQSKTKVIQVTPSEIKEMNGVTISNNSDKTLGIKNSQQYIKAIEVGLLKFKLQDSNVKPNGANGEYTIDQMKSDAEGFVGGTFSFLTGSETTLRIKSIDKQPFNGGNEEKIIKGLLQTNSVEVGNTPLSETVPSQLNVGTFTEVLEKYYIFTSTHHQKQFNGAYGKHKNAPLVGKVDFGNGDSQAFPIGHQYSIKGFDVNTKTVFLEDPNFPDKTITISEEQFSGLFGKLTFILEHNTAGVSP